MATGETGGLRDHKRGGSQRRGGSLKQLCTHVVVRVGLIGGGH